MKFPRLTPEDPRAQLRIRQLEAAIKGKLLLGPADHVQRLRAELAAFKASLQRPTITEPTPSDPPPKTVPKPDPPWRPPPTPEEVARADRDGLANLSELLKEAFF